MMRDTRSEASSRPEAGTQRTVRQRPVDLQYVLVTPARNEAAFIEKTIQSVVSQTIRPVKWVIVSDGSTDGTDQIVKRYAAKQSWIELVRLPEHEGRHFGAKVRAFNAGYAIARHADHDVIGNLDADVTFEEGYFEFLLGKFVEYTQLGVVGTPFTEGSEKCSYRFVSGEHVSGACQLFRKQCFEEIGGYVPITTGGVDLVAVITARMKGWQTRQFSTMTYEHYRSQSPSLLSGAIKGGRSDYLLGCDPLWQLLRCIYRLFALRPIVLNGAFCLCGYVSAMLTRAEKVVSPEFVRFRRYEERRRLLLFLRRAFLPQIRDLRRRGN